MKAGGDKGPTVHTFETGCVRGSCPSGVLSLYGKDQPAGIGRYRPRASGFPFCGDDSRLYLTDQFCGLRGQYWSKWCTHRDSRLRTSFVPVGPHPTDRRGTRDCGAAVGRKPESERAASGSERAHAHRKSASSESSARSVVVRPSIAPVCERRGCGEQFYLIEIKVDGRTGTYCRCHAWPFIFSGGYDA